MLEKRKGRTTPAEVTPLPIGKVSRLYPPSEGSLAGRGHPVANSVGGCIGTPDLSERSHLVQASGK